MALLLSCRVLFDVSSLVSYDRRYTIGEGTMHLDIYITKQCANCGEALLIAERARSIAGLEVAVIDLEQPGQRVPPVW